MLGNQNTQEYFNKLNPTSSLRQFELAFEFIRKYSDSATKIIAIGCCDGSVLSEINRYAPSASLTGLDIRSNPLTNVEEQQNWKIVSGSILDIKTVNKIEGNFDMCLLSNMLHHLTGRNRRESYENACRCLRNAWRILKPDGFLILIEPVFSPSFLMDAAFWMKKALGICIFKCINLFGLSRPDNDQIIASYYAEKQIRMMVEHLKGLRFLEKRIEDKTRLAGFVERMNLGFILHKVPASY